MASFIMRQGDETMSEKRILTPKFIASVAVLSAVAFVLMLFDFPLLFIAPSFYKFDFSEVSVLIGGFALGPWAAVAIESVKIVLKLLFKPTTTLFVGEFANWILGISFTVIASIIYNKSKTKKTALLGMLAATVVMAIVGVIANYFVLLPFYSQLYGMPISAFVEMGSAIFPFIHDIWGLLLVCVLPFNLLKGIVVSFVTILLYKRVARLLH